MCWSKQDLSYDQLLILAFTCFCCPSSQSHWYEVWRQVLVCIFTAAYRHRFMFMLVRVLKIYKTPTFISTSVNPLLVTVLPASLPLLPSQRRRECTHAHRRYLNYRHVFIIPKYLVFILGTFPLQLTWKVCLFLYDLAAVVRCQIISRCTSRNCTIVG